MWIKNLAFWRKKSDTPAAADQNYDKRLISGSPLSWAGQYYQEHGREETVARLESLIDSEWKVDAFIALGNIERLTDRFNEALAYYKQAVAEDAEALVAWVNLAQLYRQQKQLLLAKRAATRARALAPDNPQVYVELLSNSFDIDEAAFLRYLDEAEKKQLRHPTITRIHASYLSDRGRVEEAMAVIDRDLRDLGDGQSAEAQELGFLRMLIYTENNLLDEAIACGQQLVSDFPEFGMARMKLGVLCRNRARYDEALHELKLAETLMRDGPQAPVPRWHMALTHFLQGECEHFWEDYEYRRLCDDFKMIELPLPEWNGEAADITLYLASEQGIGDEIMFAGFISRIAPKVSKLIIECSHKLVSIYRDSFPEARIVSIEEGREQKVWKQADNYLSIGSLPKVLQLTTRQQLHNDRYLRACEEYEQYYRDKYRRPGELLVGISWRGGVRHTRTVSRSVAIDEFLTLLNIPGVRFISLQYNTDAEERQLIDQHPAEVIFDDEAIADYRRTAALVAAVDVVVSVQTAIVHLAGALGTPVKALISYGPEWRYAGDDKMLWYENVTLLRQAEEGNWRPVVEAAANELSAMLERQTS